jgi:hypothetical protein
MASRSSSQGYYKHDLSAYRSGNPPGINPAITSLKGASKIKTYGAVFRAVKK